MNGNNKVVCCYVIRKEVIRKSSVSKVLKHMEKYFKYNGSMVVTFDGYDNDKRELCEIPEVVAFTTELITEYPQVIFNVHEYTLYNFINIVTGTVAERCFLSEEVELAINLAKLKKLFIEPIEKYKLLYCKSEEHYTSLINVIAYFVGLNPEWKTSLLK